MISNRWIGVLWGSTLDKRNGISSDRKARESMIYPVQWKNKKTKNKNRKINILLSVLYMK
jgi:hypothetical protein